MAAHSYIPDKGVGDNDIQSIAFSIDWEVQQAAAAGVDCVLSGCVPTQQGSPDMTIACSKGAVLSNGVMFAVTAANWTVTTADATNPRIDLLVITSAGAKAVRAGTAAAAPKPPARTANDVVCGHVYVAANDTTMTDGQISRASLALRTGTGVGGPIVIYKTIAAETSNANAAAVHILNKANSGVTIPNGLFLTGRIMRVCIGGNVLANSGTTAWQWLVGYGGTTMFADTSAASVADADRAAFFCEFYIVAQGGADQAMAGHVQLGGDLQTARTAPATGIGDVWGIASVGEGPPAMAGSAAVNSDTADRLLTCTVVTGANNAANEIVVEWATVELL